jgi:hypothetical protein
MLTLFNETTFGVYDYNKYSKFHVQIIYEAQLLYSATTILYALRISEILNIGQGRG